MTKIVFSILVALILILVFLTVSAASRDIRDLDSRYDVTAERTFEGTVAGTPYLFEGMMYFPLKTSGRTMEVQLGPKAFVESHGFKLKAGEMVGVVGVPVKLRGREVLLAREVRSVTGVFMLRDRNGGPMWDPTRPVQMDTEFAELPIC